MSQSIKIKTYNYNFKFRVSGVIICDNKLLTVDMDKSGFLVLPGGYVELGETTEEAVIRETKEEIGRDFIIKEYLGVMENYFINKFNNKMHEICFYYLLEPKKKMNTKDFTLVENDKGNEIYLEFKWINIQEIDNYDFRPEFLKQIMIKNNLKFDHVIFNKRLND